MPKLPKTPIKAKHGAKVNFGKGLKWVAGTLIVLILGIVLSPTIAPMIYPDTPNLIIQVYRDPIQPANGSDIYGLKWDSRFVVFDVGIQVGTKNTPIEDVFIVVDFNVAVLKIKDQAAVGVTNPSLTFPQMNITVGGTGKTDQKPTQFFVNIEKLASDGLYALHVVVDPEYHGPTFRSYIISYPGYYGKYHYNAYGYPATKEVSGLIPTG